MFWLYKKKNKFQGEEFGYNKWIPHTEYNFMDLYYFAPEKNEIEIQMFCSSRTNTSWTTRQYLESSQSPIEACKQEFEWD